MLKTSKDFWKINDLFERWSHYSFHEHPSTRLRVFIEKVHAFSGQGVSSCFTFGESFGRVKQAALLADSDPTFVPPRQWQKHYGLIQSGPLTQTEKKNINKNLACKLAGQNLIHAYCDAFLIAKYGYDEWTSLPSGDVRKPTKGKRKKTSSS